MEFNFCVRECLADMSACTWGKCQEGECERKHGWKWSEKCDSGWTKEFDSRKDAREKCATNRGREIEKEKNR